MGCRKKKKPKKTFNNRSSTGELTGLSWERADSSENDSNYEYEYAFADNEGHRDSHGYTTYSTDNNHSDIDPIVILGSGASTVRRATSSGMFVPQRPRFKYPPKLGQSDTMKYQETVYYRRGLCGWISKKWDHVGDISSAEEQSDIVEGRWDFWKAYYCHNRVEAISKDVNQLFLVWSLLYTIGMNRHLDLIHLTHKNGGFSFLLVCLVVYIGVGYPMYVLETMMGQYGGKKPLSMLRYMAPYLQGIGPALWLRTFLIGIQSLVTAIYSLHYFLDLYVCQINHSDLLANFCRAGASKGKGTQLNETVILSAEKLEIGLDTEIIGFLMGAGIREWMLVVLILTSIFSVAGLRSFGRLYALALKLVYLVWVAFLLYSLLRTYGGLKAGNSIMYFPLQKVMKTDWGKIISGNVWMDAVYYVISSLGLFTLVHPFFASRCFYHYRTARDGVFIIVLTIVWNVVGASTVLLFLGYVTVNRKEMSRAVEQIGGPQGLFITYVMKYNQANQLENSEYDTEYYCGLFYVVVAFMSITSFHSCLRALIQSSFQEHTSMILASLVIFILSLLFSLGVPLIFVTPDGVRILNCLDFYLHHTFGVIFIGGCFFWSVAYSHNFAKIVYDIRNQVHLAIFEPIGAGPALRAFYPKLYRNLIILGFLLILVHSATRRQYPVAAGVDYSGNPQVIGLVCSFLPVIFIIFIGTLACYKQRKSCKALFRPHKDWYKNWYHTVVCFVEPEPISNLAKS